MVVEDKALYEYLKRGWTLLLKEKAEAEEEKDTG